MQTTLSFFFFHAPLLLTENDIHPFRPLHRMSRFCSSRTISRRPNQTQFSCACSNNVCSETMVHHKQVRSLKSLPSSKDVSINFCFWDSSVVFLCFLYNPRGMTGAYTSVDRKMTTVSLAACMCHHSVDNNSNPLSRTACISPLPCHKFFCILFFF